MALALSRKSGRAGEDGDDAARRCSAPPARPPAASIEVKLGAKKDGTIIAAEVVLKFQAGAFPGSPVGPGCMSGLAMYDMPNVRIIGYDVVTNRPKVAAYRAPGAPIVAFGGRKRDGRAGAQAGHGPDRAAREERRAQTAPRRHYGPTYQNIGYLETLEAVEEPSALCKVPLGPNQGRGIACGFWFNVGGESTAAVHINEDGTVTVATSATPTSAARAPRWR